MNNDIWIKSDATTLPTAPCDSCSLHKAILLLVACGFVLGVTATLLTLEILK